MWTNEEMSEKMNKIHNMDCLEFMKQVPDNYFDLVLTDPPYGINADIKHNAMAGKNYAEVAAMDTKARIYEHIQEKANEDICTYPECGCPFDMGEDNRCLIGKRQRRATRNQRAWYIDQIGDDEIIKAWEAK